MAQGASKTEEAGVQCKMITGGAINTTRASMPNIDRMDTFGIKQT